MTDPQLDQLIDGALTHYGGAPPPNLEKRVLRHVRRRRMTGWMAASAAATMAAAAAILAIVELAPKSGPHPTPVAAPFAAPLPTQTTAAATPVPPREVRPIPRPRLIRRPVAPAGIPLTDQERRLAEFVRAYPEAARQSFVERAAQLSEPLLIAPLSTEPLNIPPLPPLTLGGE